MAPSKTQHNWTGMFQELKTHHENNWKYPSKREKNTLYNWIKNQQNKKKKGTLSKDELQKLNSISFAWDIREYKCEVFIPIRYYW